MFKNKYLKQLKDVQARIKNCKAAIAELEPPIPFTTQIGHNIRGYIDSLTLKLHPDIRLAFRNWDDETYDYLYKLGEYFMNVADYEKKQKQYNQELGQFQAEENHLKRKLGID